MYGIDLDSPPPLRSLAIRVVGGGYAVLPLALLGMHSGPGLLFGVGGHLVIFLGGAIAVTELVQHGRRVPRSTYVALALALPSLIGCFWFLGPIFAS